MYGFPKRQYTMVEITVTPTGPREFDVTVGGAGTEHHVTVPEALISGT